MNGAIGPLQSTSIRVLAVGSSSPLRAAATALDGDGDGDAEDGDEDGAVSVEGPRTTLGTDADAVDDSIHCLLTDDLDLLEAVGGDDRPVVFVDAADGATVEAALSAGAAEVVTAAALEEPTLLRHRVRRTVRSERARAALEDREDWYRTLLERSSTLLVVLDEEFRRTYVSPSVERMVGYEPEELLEAPVDEVLHPEDREEFLATLDAVAEGDLGATDTCEYRCRHADGSWCVHEAVFTNRLDDPAVEGIVLSIRDVTAYHRVERELRESFDRVTDAFLALDDEWRFTYVNDRAEDILEREESDLLGRTFLEVFPGVAGSAFEYEAVTAMTNQEPRTVEGYYEPMDAWIEARVFPSATGISVYFRDVSERVARERELLDRTERLQAVVENVPVVLFVLDTDGRFTLSEGRGLEKIGLGAGDVVGESLFDVFEDSGIQEDAARALDGDPVYSHREVGDRIFETWYRPVTRGDDLERVIGIAIDVTERVTYEETLGAMHEATRHLLAVESKQAACEYIVDVAADVLDLTSVVVYRFDERENELYPAAYSSELTTHVGTPPRFGPNESITWEAFVDGTPQVYDDVRTASAVYDESTDVRSGLYVPLGEHGVLVAFSTESGLYDDQTVELVQLFAATAEAALDRIGRTRRLHEREQELRRQNERLERLNRAGNLREDVEQLLLRADSREEIERGVCERVTDVDDWAFAWIGEPDPGGNRVVSRATAGLDRGYLDAVTVTTVDDPAAEPTGRAARSRRPTYVDNVADAIREGAWRPEALSRSVQSVYAVPLLYDDFLYGVLSIYATRRDAFDETHRGVLTELGETVAYAIDAVQRKNALLGDEVTEVELAVDDGGPLSALSGALGATVDLRGVISQEDGSTVVFAEIDGEVDADEVNDVDGLDDAAVIGRADGRTVVQLRLVEPFLGSIVDAHGGVLREFVVDGDEVRATVDVPPSIEVRELLSTINRRGLSVSLLARRDRSSAGDGRLRGPYREPVSALEDLTDRQREVVQAAYHGGFFEWPRQATGEEVADSLGISPPAFHNHVRTAERKLFAALFDGEGVGG
ncbi:PAS domain S-box protein [Salinilacihabitans rarus]|uniref:PAS domain S-box protein n=1 Tax=Salinilacihabitans rarus TaxID=2961596 RepID=UPI0020C912E4|nr:PAS domain S-box protein [Salinilacihabitans rarus]